MNPNTESTKTEGKTIEATYSTTAFATLYTKGLERVVEVSKTSMDSAIQQNAEVLAQYKEALKASPAPVSFLLDLVGDAFEGYVTLQKSLLDLTVEQNSAVIEATQEYSHDPNKVKGVFTNLFQQSVDRTVTAQTSVLNFVAKQTKAASDTVKQQSVEPPVLRTS